MTSSVPDRSWAPATFPAYTPTVANLLREGSRRYGERACVVAPEERLTCRRQSDLIKTRGSDVAPAEVERALLEVRGIRDLLRQQLSSYKVPRHVFFLTDADVPWLVSQKVDRRARCDMAQKVLAQA